MMEDVETSIPKNSSNPSISIAMATYNGEKYIREQLNSLAAQTMLPCELVVTDDGSTDRTLEIVRDFARTVPFEVKIYCNKTRLGYAENFLKAASLCVGELIAFCDQDDVWLKTKNEICAAAFKDPEILLCVHSSRIWRDGQKLGKFFPRFKRRCVLSPASADPLGSYNGFSTVIRKSALSITNNHDRPLDLLTLGSDPKQMAHDQWVWFIASIFGKIVIIPEVLCLYRQHENNLFGVANKTTLQRIKLGIFRLDYSREKVFERDCSQYIDRISNSFSVTMRSRALKAMEKVNHRARLHELRQIIYAEESRFFDRLRAVFLIAGLRGYSDQIFQFSFGPRALIKDFFFGAIGIYKFALKAR